MITVEKARGYSKPHHLDFENNGVINPGIYQGEILYAILYRAVQEGTPIGYAK
jgi:hypothetical protein